jgi:hypothetical protein
MSEDFLQVLDELNGMRIVDSNALVFAGTINEGSREPTLGVDGV